MKISYITYQSFPAETANSIQTISNILEIVKQGHEISLVFPNREKDSNGKLKELQEYYNFVEEFEVHRLKHYLPFGRIKIFNKFFFHISHFLWSFFVSNLNKDYSSADLILTRSDWIFYFFSRRKKNIIFECHTESKLRNILMKRSLMNENSKIVYITKSLENKYKNLQAKKEQGIVLESGYREDLFSKSLVKVPNQVVFVGNLLRFGKSRDIEFLIDCFKNQKLHKYSLIIVGGPAGYVEELRKKLDKNQGKNIRFTGRLNQKQTSKLLLESEVGILINSNTNINSLKHTSPLKYYEYLAAKLKVVAIDFDAHKNLPLADNIKFFDGGNEEHFINALLSTSSLRHIEENEIQKYSYKARIKKLIDFARLEGLEPPTL